MEGYAGDADHPVGNWIFVSNDNGSSWSTAQTTTTGTWSTNSGLFSVETAGGTSELWGKTWTVDQIKNIDVKLEWSTTNGDAVFLDYVKVRVTYTDAPTTYTSDDGTIDLKDGTLDLKNGLLIIK